VISRQRALLSDLLGARQFQGVGNPYLIALRQSSASERSRAAADAPREASVAAYANGCTKVSGEEAPMTHLRKNCATLGVHPTSFSLTSV
jgi:hypothetical protein